ncbi:MAG: hypothetical protein V1689_10230 [Pseudomonadota bacterium]
MTDREGLFSKGRNPNSSQPVPRPLTFKYPDVIGTQAGERKKDPRGPLPFFQNAKVLHQALLGQRAAGAFWIFSEEDAHE